ncbi:MAG: histidine phosphatase family protein [Patescibacteria group bacterium]
MATLFLLRHLKSQWNEDNRFAGWVDNPLSKEAHADAKEIADKLINVHRANIDVVYTSPLIRNTETVLRVFDNIVDKYPLFLHLDGGKMQKWSNFTDVSMNDVPVYISENLNERYYGKLQGLNKDEIIQKYGEKEIHDQRRGFLKKPPGGESLKDVYKRAVPFYKRWVERDLAKGRNVLLVASHNSLRAIVKYIENISDKKIADVELPFGALMKYEFELKISKNHFIPGGLQKKVQLVSKKYF